MTSTRYNLPTVILRLLHLQDTVPLENRLARLFSKLPTRRRFSSPLKTYLFRLYLSSANVATKTLSPKSPR